jgi:hypothetical protein
MTLFAAQRGDHNPALPMSATNVENIRYDKRMIGPRDDWTERRNENNRPVIHSKSHWTVPAVKSVSAGCEWAILWLQNHERGA